jgi:septal ring factor EnvC (AmiA/AmiB activator)
MKLKFLPVIMLLGLLAGCATAPETHAPKAEYAKPKAKSSLWYPTKKEIFAWPVRGQVISYFGNKVGKVKNKGIDIRAEEGEGVRAAKAGKVVYRDARLKGFGKTVIVDHGDRFQTVYSYNSDILVNVGDIVWQNMVIAKVGRTGRAKESSLHFEVRRDGVPLNPVNFLKR